jgi:hypothetical protein
VADGLVGFGLMGNNVGVNLYGSTDASEVGTIIQTGELVSTLAPINTSKPTLKRPVTLRIWWWQMLSPCFW